MVVLGKPPEPFGIDDLGLATSPCSRITRAEPVPDLDPFALSLPPCVITCNPPFVLRLFSALSCLGSVLRLDPLWTGSGRGQADI